MIDVLIQKGWEVKRGGYQVIPAFVSDKQLQSQTNIDILKEIVFLGTLDIAGGLELFLDSIQSSPLLKSLPVSFIGSSGKINDLTSEEYIEMRMANWGSTWSIMNNMLVSEIVNYLKEQGKGRVTVMPSVVETYGYVIDHLLRNGLPFVTSNKPSIYEHVAFEDVSKITAQFNSSISLGRQLVSLTSSKPFVARPFSNVGEVSARWIRLHQELVESSPKSCPAPVELSNKETPLVTVVLVHHDRPELLKQAIQSIEAQTFQNFEVILVDDGSKNQESLNYLNEIAWIWWEKKGWKVLREPNRYLGAARNTGARHATGKYIVFMDDDDFAKPHQIETFLKVALETNADVVTSGHDLFSGGFAPNNQLLSDRYLPLGPATLVGMLENCYGDAKMLVRKEFFLDMGGFTEDFGVGFEDYEFLSKVALQGHRLEAVSEPLNWYRIHQTSMSATTDLKANQARFMRAYVEEYPRLDNTHQSLLRNTRDKFFPRDDVIGSILTNTTTLITEITTTTIITTTTTTTTTVLPTSTTTTPTPTTTTTTTSAFPTPTRMFFTFFFL